MSQAPQPSASAKTPASSLQPWWARDELCYDPAGRLCFAGERALDLAARGGTPAYFYSGSRITENVGRFRAAIDELTGTQTRVLYAMKSNRFSPVLQHLRTLGVGLDVCSPGEVRHALSCGFKLDELSFTAGSLSIADYAEIGRWPQLWVNADSLTALRRIAEVSPGRVLGLRINPAAGLGYGANPLVRYAGARPTKFGIYLDRFLEALELAQGLGLTIGALHCHAGCGFLTPQLPALDAVFANIRTFLDAAPSIRRLNLGGGLGIPLTEDDAPLDLRAWSSLIQAHFGNQSLLLEFEPGDYFVKDAGILLAEVTQVEEKGGCLFAGLNVGFNVHPEPAFYHLPLAAAPAQLRPGPPKTVTLAGNINEALDVWGEDVALPPLLERDVLCLLNAGGYGASMSSSHCLRTEFSEHFLPAPPLDQRASTIADTLSQANKRAWDHLYGSTRELVWGAMPLPFVADFLDDFRRVLRTPSRILDAGTGEGRNLGVLLRCGADELHALDASVNALGKISDDLRQRVQCRQADLTATGYPDNHFDAITLLDAIETLPNNASVLGELLRILKPDGLLLCNIPGLDDGVAGVEMEAIGEATFLYRQSYYYQFIEPGAAEAMLLQAGFEIVRTSRCRWREASHPGFREQEHVHISQVFLVRKPATGA